MANNELIEPVKLSATDAQNAMDVFTSRLNEGNILLLVVPGEGPEIDTMIEAANSLINDPGNFYKAAQVIWAPKPEFILEKLQTLEVDCHIRDINWNEPLEMAMIFITCRNNIIAEIIQKPEIDKYIKSRISAGIVLALGLDEKCNKG